MPSSTPPSTPEPHFLIDLRLTTGSVVRGQAGPPVDPTFTAEDLADSICGLVKDADSAVSFRSRDGLGWLVVPSRVIACAQVWAAAEVTGA